MRASVVWKVLLVVLTLALLVAGYFVFQRMRSSDTAGPVLLEFSAESTATVALAGVFPVEGDLSAPQGMSLQGDRLYVAESDAGLISVFRSDGSPDLTLAVPAPPGGIDSYPSDVSVLPGGPAFVVDTANQRVVALDIDGDPDLAFVLGGTGLDSPGQPTSVVAGVVGDAVEVFVADSSTHEVMVYTADGDFLRSIGADLSPALTFVGAMALGDEGLYLADSNAGRVLLVDPADGNLIRVLDTRMRLPRGISLSPDGRVFVCDSFERTVEIFSADGNLVDAIGTDSTEGYESGGALGAPRGAVWLDDDSRLYVTDSTAGVVRVYNVRDAQ
jgi:hypothetical protein